MRTPSGKLGLTCRRPATRACRTISIATGEQRDVLKQNDRKDRIVETDWAGMTLGERIEHLEVEGYLVLPDLLNPDHIRRLQAETARFETFHVDYSVHQKGRQDIQFRGGAITELIAHPPLIEFLKALCGPELIFMSYDYARSEPGHPGISLHCDGQPWGSEIFGYEQSCPRLIRVVAGRLGGRTKGCQRFFQCRRRISARCARVAQRSCPPSATHPASARSVASGDTRK